MLALGQDDAEAYVRSISLAGGEAIVLSQGQPLPGEAAGLCVAGCEPFTAASGPVPPALIDAINADMPVLGIDGGLHAINLAFGGRSPVPVEGHCERSGEETGLLPAKHRIFLAPGGKLAETIGGAGFAVTSSANTHGIKGAAQAPGLMSSAYALHDGAIEALERPGRHWLLGVQWRAHIFEEQPSGFENLIYALVGVAAERAATA